MIRRARRISRLLCTAVAVVALGACHRDPPAAKLPPMLIDQRGVAMPLDKAVSHIAFRPYLPPGDALKYAAIPPLGGADVTANDGFAVEYPGKRVAMLLSEWPKHEYNVAFIKTPLRDACKPVDYSRDGVSWLSRNNVLMTLQPDGDVSVEDVRAEAGRLIAAGACR